MNKQLKWVLRVINIGCFLALILSCIVPIERKETLTSNIDVSSYGNLHSIPRIGSVTDEKQMKLKFNLYDEKLYGVNLYFGVDGDDENGKVTCAIEYNNETLAKQTFSVKELASLTEGSSLNSVEILLDDFEKREWRIYGCNKGNRNFSRDSCIRFRKYKYGKLILDTKNLEVMGNIIQFYMQLRL